MDASVANDDAFRAALMERMQSMGVIGSLKSQLRSQLVSQLLARAGMHAPPPASSAGATASDENDASAANAQPPAHAPAKPVSKRQRALCRVVAQWMALAQLPFSRSVLLAEANLSPVDVASDVLIRGGSARAGDVSDALAVLRVDADRLHALDGDDAGGASACVLERVIDDVVFAQRKPVLDEGTQTDRPLGVPASQLDARLEQINHKLASHLQVEQAELHEQLDRRMQKYQVEVDRQRVDALQRLAQRERELLGELTRRESAVSIAHAQLRTREQELQALEAALKHKSGVLDEKLLMFEAQVKAAQEKAVGDFHAWRRRFEAQYADDVRAVQQMRSDLEAERRRVAATVEAARQQQAEATERAQQLAAENSAAHAKVVETSEASIRLNARIAELEQQLAAASERHDIALAANKGRLEQQLREESQARRELEQHYQRAYVLLDQEMRERRAAEQRCDDLEVRLRQMERLASTGASAGLPRSRSHSALGRGAPPLAATAAPVAAPTVPSASVVAALEPSGARGSSSSELGAAGAQDQQPSRRYAPNVSGDWRRVVEQFEHEDAQLRRSADAVLQRLRMQPGTGAIDTASAARAAAQQPQQLEPQLAQLQHQPSRTASAPSITSASGERAVVAADVAASGARVAPAHQAVVASSLSSATPSSLSSSSGSSPRPPAAAAALASQARPESRSPKANLTVDVPSAPPVVASAVRDVAASQSPAAPPSVSSPMSRVPSSGIVVSTGIGSPLSPSSPTVAVVRTRATGRGLSTLGGGGSATRVSASASTDAASDIAPAPLSGGSSPPPPPPQQQPPQQQQQQHPSQSSVSQTVARTASPGASVLSPVAAASRASHAASAAAPASSSTAAVPEQRRKLANKWLGLDDDDDEDDDGGDADSGGDGFAAVGSTSSNRAPAAKVADDSGRRTASPSAPRPSPGRGDATLDLNHSSSSSALTEIDDNFDDF